MDLELERTGGLVGLTQRWSVDVDALPGPERAEVQDLLAQAPGWSGAGAARPGGADRFSYRLRASPPDGEPLDVRFAEPLPEPAQRLVALVRTPAAAGAGGCGPASAEPPVEAPGPLVDGG